MTASRQELHPAYVIHNRAYRDTSLIVEVFTPSHGRVSLLARGAKSGKAKKAQILQPFRSLHVSWAGRGELPVLAVAEEAGSSLRLQGVALACGYYVNELIYYLLPRHEPAADLFVQYWPTIMALRAELQRDYALRQFEFTLLQQLGYAPLLSHDIETGEAISADKSYRYRIPDGPVDATLTTDSGVVVSGHTLLELERQQYSELSRIKEVRDLSRALIHYHLDGRELKSRALFKQFSDLQAGTH